MHTEEFCLALTQFVEVALSDTSKDRTVSYAKNLSKFLRHNGNDDTADQVDEIVTSRGASVASPSRKSRDTPIPVDTQSRLSVADRKWVENSVDVVLPESTGVVVSRMINSIKKSDELRERGVTVPRSMLLHGPPGCGKTLLAEHIAQSLSLPIVTARADGLVSSYLGSTAKNIRSLFEYASQNECILFLDEFDAIAKMRDDRHELGELKRVVIALLQNIDASTDSVIFLAATNHPHLLDPAVWRRFSYSVEMPLPDEHARKLLISRFFHSELPQDSIEILATLSEGISGADLRRLAEDSIRESVLEEKKLTLANVIQTFVCSANQRPASEDEKYDDKRDNAIRKVRRKHGKSLTQTTLANAFGISQSQVSRILNEREPDEEERILTH